MCTYSLVTTWQKASSAFQDPQYILYQQEYPLKTEKGKNNLLASDKGLGSKRARPKMGSQQRSKTTKILEIGSREQTNLGR